ncbi:ATP-binding protein [Streptomyces sp. NPDC006430]|uniref:ATP-binding protein n=1 Tax=Streptomyces sp. NPDC006430 TaxID=3154299 RepID=UPI00339F666D
MTASSSPLRPSALALLVTALVYGALCTAAVAAAPTSVRTPLAWFAGSGALLLALAAFAVTWSTRTARMLRTRISTLSAELAARDAELARRTADAAREAAAHTHERNRTAATHAATIAQLTSAHTAELDHLATAQQATREQLGRELRRAESGRAAAMAAAANAAGRMQALATGMLADLRDMEHRHADEDVLGDLLHLDHRTAQAGRLADSIAVLTGARSGRRWAKPIVMESILRGAMGRIGGYQRVRLHCTSDAAVAGHAAEGVMHALAELLDNAANFSPPNAEVHVYVEEVPAGVVITVEDSGLVMSELQLRRAEAAVCGESHDLAGLSGTRLGLAVVGRLARKHGLTVSFRPSARGGTGALMMLPHELITRTPHPAASPAATRTAIPAAREPRVALDFPARPTPSGAGAPAAADASHRPAADAADTGSHTRADAGHGSPADTTGQSPQFGESGLPKRRRGRTLAAAHPDGPDTPGPVRTSPPPSDASRSAARFSSFRQAVRGTSAQPPVPGEPAPSQNPPHLEGNTE